MAEQAHAAGQFPSPQRMIANQMESALGFRAEKAEEYPEDIRNANSVAALRRLIGEVEQVPDGHPAILMIEALGGFLDDHTVYLPGERARRYLSRTGFHRGPSTITVDDWLAGLAAAHEEDAAREAEEALMDADLDSEGEATR